MSIVWLVIIAISLAFSVVIFFGAPYVPTLKAQEAAAFELLKLKAGQVFIDLGCGDGRMLVGAAERGLTAIGVELNPFLVIIAKVRTRKHGNRIKVVWGNFWWSKKELVRADGVFVFLRQRYMARLDRLMAECRTKKPAKLASYAFQIPGKKALFYSKGIYLYQYPSIAPKS